MSSKKVIIVIAILFVLIGIYIIINSNIKVYYAPTYKIDDFYTIPTRQMQVNEYKVVEVSESEMAKKYFTTFISDVFENSEKTYDLLEEDYREMKYPTYGNYLAYLKEITDDFTIMPKMAQYKRYSKDNKMVYVILDQNDNKYVFLIEAVMKYKMQFEE